MKSKLLVLFAVASFGGAAALSGCSGGGSPATGSGGNGSGGSSSGGSGSGGKGSGGATGSGGSTSSGGASSGGASSGGSSSGGASSGGSSSGGSSSGGASSGGATGSGGSTSSGGASSGGATGSGGSAGTGSGGSAMGGAAGGSTGGSGSSAWTCPSGVTGSPFSGTTVAATRIAGAPPADAFNNMGNDFTNVEGPVWIGDSLYVSEMKTTNVPPARIVKIGPNDAVSEFITDSGTNGMATDGTNLVTANHKAHGIVRFSLSDKAATTLVSMANSKALNSPNDVTIASNGTLYFTDPDYQNNAKPQGSTRVYQWKMGDAAATAITDYMMEPNGISLSLDEQTLIVGGQAGVKKYPIASGAVAMTGTSFGPMEVTASGNNTDGMTLDCAGNLYVAHGDSAIIYVVKPDGTKLGTVTLPSGGGQAVVTNVAFGGTDHQTLYITAQGSGKGQGVFKVHMNIPGMPY